MPATTMTSAAEIANDIFRDCLTRDDLDWVVYMTYGIGSFPVANPFADIDVRAGWFDECVAAYARN